MKINLNSVSTKLFLSFSIIFCLVISFLYYFQFLPVHKKLSDSSLNEKLNIMLNLYKNTLSSALESSDDVTMLNSIENIMRFDGVSSVYILDKNGKVLTHDNTSEWGKTYNDNLTKNALLSNFKRIQNAGKDNDYLFSVPLSTSATLCVGLTKEKTEKNLAYIEQNYLYTSLIIFIITVSIILVIINSQIAKRFNVLDRLIESITLSKKGVIPDIGKDEFGEIATHINILLSSLQISGSLNSGDLFNENKNYIGIISELLKTFATGIMVIDSENRITALNRPFGDFLSIDEKSIIGKHILDVIKTADLTTLITKSSQTPGSPIRSLINGRQIEALSLTNSAGVILSIK